MPQHDSSTVYSSLFFLLSAIVAVAGSMALTGLMQKTALHFGWTRKPTSARHVHTEAIPRLGGVAVFLTVVGIVGIGVCASPGGGEIHRASVTLAWLLLPASMLFAVGLIDDVKPLPARLKLAAQIGAGVWLHGLGYSVMALRNSAAHGMAMQALGLSGTIVWVVLVSNAVNLIDGLDGLAAGSSLVSLVTLFTAACLRGDATAALGTALVGGAVLGFLRHNFNPASIFLGDGGSLFLGFLLSAFGLMGTLQVQSHPLLSLALPALALGLPIAEVMLSVSRRFLSCKRLFEPDRMHIHHRLMDGGLSHRGAVLALYGVSAVFGLLSLVLVYPTWAGLAVAMAAMMVLGSAGVLKLGYPEFAELARLPRRVVQQRRAIANAVTISRAVRLLERAQTLAEIKEALQLGFPGDCFQEMRLSLVPVVIVRSGLFSLATRHGPSFTVPGGLEKKAAQGARLVMDLESRAFHGSLEFVLTKGGADFALNVGQVFSDLQKALNAALDRLPHRPETMWIDAPEDKQPLIFPLPAGTRASTLHMVQ